MLTKLLFTAFVIALVYVFYRHKGRPGSRKKSVLEAKKTNPVGRIYAYGFIAFLILVSLGVFFYQYQEAHTIVTIRVIDGESEKVTIYMAYRKSIKGNRFESLDGRSVVLGEAQRVEFIEED